MFTYARYNEWEFAVAFLEGSDMWLIVFKKRVLTKEHM